MNYHELVFTILDKKDYLKDILINDLANIGFDSFEEINHGFSAYIPSGQFDTGRIKKILEPYKEKYKFSYDINIIPEKNWNEIWESNFEPVNVADKLYIRADFHKPKIHMPLEIIINPKMAFGTGHHETTYLMCEYLLQTEIEGRCVLDMGCGSGILSIIAFHLGALEIAAVDIDETAVNSTIENSILNEVDTIKVYKGSIEEVKNHNFDIILANINKNTLLDNMALYAAILNDGGELFLSGFYETPDLADIQQEASKYGLKYISCYTKNNWVVAKFLN